MIQSQNQIITNNIQRFEPISPTPLKKGEQQNINLS